MFPCLRILSSGFEFTWGCILVKPVSWLIVSSKVYHSNRYIFNLCWKVWDESSMRSGQSFVWNVSWYFHSRDFRSVSCDFWYVYVQSFSEVYPASFYPCVCKRFLILFKSNLEISSVLFLSSWSSSWSNFHYFFLEPLIAVDFLSGPPWCRLLEKSV